jgi:hypothetical protein
VVRYRQLRHHGHDRSRISRHYLPKRGRNAQSTDPKVQRFLGVSPGNGKALGLDEKWAYNIVKMVGNYGEVFERNVGVNTPLKSNAG